jgi:monovalent cation:H+ antiporter-2, CPA2 family
MHVDVISGIAIVAVAAAVLVWLLQKLGQSAVIAYLVLGVVCGPSGARLLDASEEVGHLSEIGVVFLLFFIGLEFHVSTLRRTAGLVFGGTALQVIACGAPVFGAAMLFGLGWREAFVLGICTALSSTAIVMKAFEDRGEADTPAAGASLSILIGQDLVALLAVAALPAMLGARPAGGQSPAVDFAVMAVSLPILFVVSRKLFPFMFRRAALARNQEAFALCSLAACLLVAFAAHQLKASYALGAFLGGLVFAGTPYAHQIRADLASLKNLALGFFFFTVGMLLDVSFAISHVPLVLGCLVCLMAMKATAISLVLGGFGSPWSVAAAAGLALCQVSEFAFVLAASAKASGALSTETSQLLLAVAVLSMLVAPTLVARANLFGRKMAGILGRDVRSPAAPPAAAVEHRAVGSSVVDGESTITGQETVRAVVIGYGPVGRVLCKILIRFGVNPCVIDLQLDTVRKLHGIQREAVYGDAAKREVLEAAGVPTARYLLITLPDLGTRAAVAASARAVNPQITIITRARYLVERVPLEQSGADHISYEEAEVAAELSRLLLNQLGVREDLLQHEIRKLRSEIAIRTGFTQVFRRPLEAPAGQTEIWTAAQLEDAMQKAKDEAEPPQS